MVFRGLAYLYKSCTHTVDKEVVVPSCQAGRVAVGGCYDWGLQFENQQQEFNINTYLEIQKMVDGC